MFSPVDGLSLEFFHLEIQMLVLPGLHGLGDCIWNATKSISAPLRSSNGAANGRFRQVTMAVPKRVIAFAVKRNVFFRGELPGCAIGARR